MFADSEDGLGKLKIRKKFKKLVKKVGTPIKVVRKITPKPIKKIARVTKRVAMAPIQIVKKAVPVVIPVVGLHKMAVRSIAKKKKKARIIAAKKKQQQLLQQGVPPAQASQIAEQQSEQEIPMTPEEMVSEASPSQVQSSAQEYFEDQGYSPAQAAEKAEAVAEGTAPVPEEVAKKVEAKMGIGAMLPLLLIGGGVLMFLGQGGKKNARSR